MDDKWCDTTLGEIVELKRGYDLPSRDRRVGPFPIVSSSGVSGYHAEAKAKAPGVVIGRYGTLGEVHYVTKDYWPLNTSLYVRDFKGNDPRFISYLLRCLDFRAYSDKAAVPGLNRNDLHTSRVRVPPLPEQRAIAEILGSLDDKIELNRRMNETLEAMARAIFKSWFVDFEPVRAKMEGRWRRGQSLPGLPADLFDLFPDSFEDSELGEIPLGWRSATLERFAFLNPESWRKDTQPELIRYIDLSNVKHGRIEEVATYAKDDAPSRAQRVLKPGDTIVGTVRPGNCSYAFVTQEGLTASTGFAVLRPRSTVCTRFVYFAATDLENLDRLARLSDGGAYPAVRPETVLATQVVQPPVPLIARFSTLTEPWLEKVAGNERESRSLSRIRDVLLPKLISGEIRVAQTVEALSAAK